jgi:hypothetical protein
MRCSAVAIQHVTSSIRHRPSRQCLWLREVWYRFRHWTGAPGTDRPGFSATVRIGAEPRSSWQAASYPCSLLIMARSTHDPLDMGFNTTQLVVQSGGQLTTPSLARSDRPGSAGDPYGRRERRPGLIYVTSSEPKRSPVARISGSSATRSSSRSQAPAPWIQHWTAASVPRRDPANCQCRLADHWESPVLICPQDCRPTLPVYCVRAIIPTA